MKIKDLKGVIPSGASVEIHKDKIKGALFEDVESSGFVPYELLFSGDYEAIPDKFLSLNIDMLLASDSDFNFIV